MGKGVVTESTQYLYNKATWLSIPHAPNSHPPTQMQKKKKKNHKTHRILVEMQDSLRSESIDSEAIIPNRPQACQMESSFFFQKTSTRMISSAFVF